MPFLCWFRLNFIQMFFLASLVVLALAFLSGATKLFFFFFLLLRFSPISKISAVAFVQISLICEQLATALN